MSRLLLFLVAYVFSGTLGGFSCFAQETEMQTIDIESFKTPRDVVQLLPPEHLPPIKWNIPWDKVKNPRVRWHMTWSNELEALKNRIIDYSYLIAPVTIQTVFVDNKLLTYRAYAGCNRISGSLQKYILKPETLSVKVVNGGVSYETTPEDIGTRISELTRTLKGCNRVAEGKDGNQVYIDISSTMESFILKNAPKATHIHNGDELKWVDENGVIIARFEKLADLTIQRNLWVLDPEIHDNDPILEQYFPPARVRIDFPYTSISRGCGSFLAKVDITDKNFQLSSKVSTLECEDLFDLDKGQRVPYTPNEDATYNLLARYMPQIKSYRVTGDDETRRLVLSNHEGKDLLHLISFKSLSRRQYQTHIYDQLDGHEWVIEPHENITKQTLNSVNPVRIFRSESLKDEPKGRASIVSAQNCNIFGLNVSRSNTTYLKSEHLMNVYNSNLNAYPRCHGPAGSELKAEWKKAKKLLFDDSYLIFYDEDWNEVMRSKRGKSLEVSKGP